MTTFSPRQKKKCTSLNENVNQKFSALLINFLAQRFEMNERMNYCTVCEDTTEVENNEWRLLLSAKCNKIV